MPIPLSEVVPDKIISLKISQYYEYCKIDDQNRINRQTICLS